MSTQVDQVEALLPCPFCGGQAVVARWFKHDVAHFTANCKGCDATATDCDNPQAAAHAWNARATWGVQPFAWDHVELDGLPITSMKVQVAGHVDGKDYLLVKQPPVAEPQPQAPNAVRVVRIDRHPNLDPIVVYIEDIRPGGGRATIACYNEAWTCFWGAMGDRTLLQFVAGCDSDYVARNMLCGRRRVANSEQGYVERIAQAFIIAAQAEGGAQ